MEFKNSCKIEPETESPVNRKDINLERNAAEDDENRSIGDSEIVGKGTLDESAGVQMISKKKRRGRPRRKPLPLSPQRSLSTSPGSGIISKRRLGRPPGRGRLQLLASLGGFAWDTAGGSFTPHVIHVAVGEDIVKRISTFSRKGPRAICIISAVGLISTVLLHQPGPENRILRFEGTFEILCLSGSFIRDMNGKHVKQGEISISLARPNGQVFGGIVASSLIAASCIQIIVGSFKQKLSNAVKNLHTPGYNTHLAGAEEEEEVCSGFSLPH